MANFKVPEDYDENSENGYAPLPSGEYCLVIEKCTHGISPKSGKEMYNIQFGVVGSKRKLFDRIVTSPEHLMQYPFSVNKLCSFLRACGIAVAKGQDIPLPNPITLQAKKVYATVSIDKKDDSKNVIFFYHKEAKANRPAQAYTPRAPRATQQAPDPYQNSQFKGQEGKHPDTGEDVPF